jgi:hypothetical protein
MKTTYHRDGTVTLWHVYEQAWHRTGAPTGRLLASLDPDERLKVLRHTKKWRTENGVTNYPHRDD